LLIQNKSACKGDSGGPLLVREVSNNQIKYIVSGIVSYGSICGDEDKPKYDYKKKILTNYILINIFL
jgi:secreted trypsin-like serine protease